MPEVKEKINITLPDGSTKEFPKGVTGLDIAEEISKSLAREVLAVDVDGEVWDATRPITKDATVKLLKFEDEGGKMAFWHSSAHLMAEALEALYPGVKFGVGPPIDQGFYYDVDLGDYEISKEDLKKVEDKMQELAQQKNTYKREEVSKEEAKKYFKEKGDPYKLELLEELEDGEITFYEQGEFTDLCRGPHIPHTGKIKAVKLLSLAGAYWKGDEENKQLTRIYGITFPKQKQLKKYLDFLEKARQRDHRKLGKQLDLFTFDDEVGPGLPLWLPNGAILIEEIEKLAKEMERKAGYRRVRTPHIAKSSLYETSGHLPYYEDDMFPPMEFDGEDYYLKAMNCPHHHKIYKHTTRSYRDLPIRLAEYGTCYRYEQSGELFGLMRVRSLQMNDAHIYCTPEQFAQEFQAVNKLYQKYFTIFDIDKYEMRFSTHNPDKLGDKYVNEPELWQQTEDMVRDVLKSSSIPYKEVADEAAFYGPKIDVQVWSAIGKEFTLATNQVDFFQPRRFDLAYINEDNESQMPICIHRAPLGTHERFIGFLIEHYAGNFPVWLAPTQVIVLPISDKSREYGEKVVKKLKNADIRTELDNRTEKVSKKIRDAEVQKIPMMLIVGPQEEENDTVSIRIHQEGDIGTKSVAEFLTFFEQRFEDSKGI